MKKFISYSQHADDFIAWQLLGEKNQGVVVEIGAFDGKHLSNSYSLSQLGWKSICVEPSPRIFKYLEKNRRDATNVNKAVVGDETVTDIEFFSEEIGVLSGCNYDEEDIKKRYQNRGLQYKEPERFSVPATTLNKLFDEINHHKINLLSIDVEGFEMEVLKGLNLNHITVDLFIIEANTSQEKEAILNYFKSYDDYMFLGNNYQNLFIARKKAIKRKNLKTLTFDGYFKAKQQHPFDDKLSLDSVPPKFNKSTAYIKHQKLFGLF
ncbi:FkbM family methyltransferase [Corallibacter sp.]|uniref:FkbM family methyltransferase n=1 Tax=Corallibacter sp. TaxID=2038084 RepID=UPI003AB66C92